MKTSPSPSAQPTAHTPGPWTVAAYDGKRNIHANDTHGKTATVWLRRTKTDNVAEIEANARLIAAAPELLAALEEIVKAAFSHRWNVNSDEVSPLIEARAAIARAKQ